MKAASLIIALLALISGIFPACNAWAEEPEKRWGGSFDLGYRFTDIDGMDRYREVVNLMEGPRLFNFSLWAKDPESKGLADSFSLKLNGIGDPFPFGRFDVKKDKAYELTATYREYKYFFNRQDDDDILTDNHDFNQKRRRGTLSLTVFPAENFRLNLGFSHSRRDGIARVPRPFIFSLFQAPNLDQDLKERLNDYFISADFRAGGWDLHIKQTFWQFENESRIESPVADERRNERVKTYVSTIKGHRQFGDSWDLDAGYVFAYSEGRSDIFTFPAIAVVPGTGDFNFNTHIIELGVSHLFSKEMVLHLDYRYHRLDQNGRSDSDPFFPDAVTTYGLDAHTATIQMEYALRENLNLRIGYRFQYRDIDSENRVANQNDGGLDSAQTQTTSHGWIGAVDWKPYAVLSVHAEYQGADFDNPYTRISPDHENIAKLRVNYETPVKGLRLKGSALWKRRTNPDQSFRIDVRDYTLSASYQPPSVPDLTFDASITYEQIKDNKELFNAIPPSFVRFSFDSDALIYAAGVRYEGIYRGLGAEVHGSLARTREENSQKYADGAFSMWYRNIYLTPVIALQRIYFSDHVRPQDSFDANLLTLSLRKDF